MGWYNSMNNIKKIMEMINWNNDTETQNKGVKWASQIKNLTIFIQPMEYGSKAVWENCAKILSERSDEELVPYLNDILEWLQDMNWPGALTITERLKHFSGEKLVQPFLYAFNKAKDLNNEDGLMWIDYLSELIDNKGLEEILPDEVLSVLRQHYHNWGGWYIE